MVTIESIQSAYLAIKQNNVSEAMINICRLIALVIVISKFITAYREAFSTGESKNGTPTVKDFFNLAYIHLAVIVVIALAPALFTVVEKALGSLQDTLNNQYAGVHDKTITEATIAMGADYINEEMEDTNTESIGGLIWTGIKSIKGTLGATTNSFWFLLFASIDKYIFFFFACGRYIYLILLEIVAPLAMICALDKDLMKTYTIPYLRNLMICYLLVPGFLIANTFAGEIAKTMFEGSLFNSHGLIGLIIALILKFSLFKAVSNYIFKLL